MSRIKYWEILHYPDTTETGEFMKILYVKTEWGGFPAQQSYEKEMLEDFCYANFGPQVDYVMGVAPTRAWLVCESTSERFEKMEPLWRWSFKPEKLVLGLGKSYSKL